MKTVYGWQDNGVWFLSRFKRVAKMPANQYATQEEVIREAESKGLVVEWLQ